MKEIDSRVMSNCSLFSFNSFSTPHSEVSHLDPSTRTLNSKRPRQVASAVRGSIRDDRDIRTSIDNVSDKYIICLKLGSRVKVPD